MIGGTDYDDVCIFVRHLAKGVEYLVEAVVAVLLDHLEVREGGLEQYFSCDKVKDEEHSKHFHEHYEVFVALFASFLSYLLLLNFAVYFFYKFHSIVGFGRFLQAVSRIRLT